MPNPTADDFYGHMEHGIEVGLEPPTAYAYAALMWWGQWYGIPPVRITSGRRDSAKQRQLWENRASNPYPVARPGTSKHELGKAFDLPSHAALDTYGGWAPYAGLKWGGTFRRKDVIHFELE